MSVTPPPPSGPILYRYIPGVGKVSAVACGVSQTETCASAYSTSSQTLVAGTAANIAHNAISFQYGILVGTGPTSYFRVPSTGTYKIIPSLQCFGSGNGTITIWIKVNGISVPNTGTRTAFKQNDETVITCEYLLQLTTGDLVEVWALAQSANCSVYYIPGDGIAPNTYPASPGIITNMYRIR